MTTPDELTLNEYESCSLDINTTHHIKQSHPPKCNITHQHHSDAYFNDDCSSKNREDNEYNDNDIISDPPHPVRLGSVLNVEKPEQQHHYGDFSYPLPLEPIPAPSVLTTSLIR